ncbi:MAG: ABC transporter permease [Oscillospiraceae bacterium]|jgi:ABC-2 type transport system permease protein|nr:ABC transporter permease [Oscillospiraceae bacterium]MCI6923152.1 ABC transporter permease [Oscillospiraceae bacterium]MCI6974083.1 ABC transporter permease [Oscillospiraceae bacterium]MCI7339271.1 ABC transporter permease [Oscillospiraceae bacterium]MCI7648846.1 ABC transporter permease [Oscillospiraceae bacterium]
MKKYFKNFYKYRFLFTEIVRKNIKLQYRNSVLGMFWTFLQPLLTMIVLAFIFGNIFGRDESKVLNYPVYLLCGRLLYEFYSQATKRAMRSIRNSASVIKKVYVPKYIYPMANVTSNFITFLISLLVLAVVMAYYMIFTDTAMRLTPYILLSFVPILILFVLCVGVGMILCTMEVFFKDVEYMYEVFCMLLFYATPIFYNVETLHITNRYAQYALMANPLYSIVSMFRDCVLFGRAMNPNHIIYSAVFSVAMLLIGVLVFYKKQDDFILHI